MRTTQEAASGFVQSLRPEDQAQVIDFDSRVSVLAPFTSSKADLEKAIASDGGRRLDLALHGDLHRPAGN
ncbi:MAG: VWA domain-containing protein [Sphingobacterium sp.]|nr:VWA domain-containing protein [Sphingobacterium sp.]